MPTGQAPYKPVLPVLINKPTIEGIPSPILQSGDACANQCVTRWSNGMKMVVDYNEDNSHVSVEGPKGSSVTLCPDGSLKMVSAAGKMGIEINGEGYIKITGVYNIEATGDIGIKTDGKCHGCR